MAKVTRLVTRHERDVRALLDTKVPVSFYLGVWCAGCECDVLPMANGRCGWCDRRLERAA